MRETNRCKQAFEDYFNLGPGRSLSGLLETYRGRTGGKASAPTRRMTTLETWSATFGWQDRIAQRDAEIAAAAMQAVIERATQNGYAIYQQRVHTLNMLAELLWGEVNEDAKRWLPDVKQIGQGEMAERVDIVRFNAPLIEQFRKTLDDIAAEMGERIKGVEVSGKGGGPIEVKEIEDIRRRRWREAGPAMAAALKADEAGGA